MSRKLAIQNRMRPHAVDAKENMEIDTSHLWAIRVRLSNERCRLEKARSDSDRGQREVLIAGIERELKGELEFLGLPPDSPPDDIDEDALLAELGVEMPRA